MSVVPGKLRPPSRGLFHEQPHAQPGARGDVDQSVQALLEGVQHVDRLREPGHIDDAEGAAILTLYSAPDNTLRAVFVLSPYHPHKRNWFVRCSSAACRRFRISRRIWSSDITSCRPQTSGNSLRCGSTSAINSKSRSSCRSGVRCSSAIRATRQSCGLRGV